MDFELTEEQALIRETARRFVQDYNGRRSFPAGFDRAIWTSLAERGFLAIGLPERHGGMGGVVELALVCQEFGHGPVLEPFLAAALFPGQLIAAAGRPVQQENLLPDIASGKRIMGVAYREPVRPEDLTPRLTRARRDGAAYILSGRKTLVSGGNEADSFIVTALAEGTAGEDAGLTLFMVSRRLDGVRIMPAPLADGSWSVDIDLDGVRLTEADILGSPGEGMAALVQALRYAILGNCAITCGAMTAALDQAAHYLTVRKQFGLLLSEFQVLRHKIADMAIDCEMAEAAILKMIASFQDPDRHDPALAVAGAKVLLDELGHRVCGQAIQIHGGMGMTEECGIGRYFARCLLNKALFGTPLDHMAHYVELLKERRDALPARVHEPRDRRVRQAADV